MTVKTRIEGEMLKAGRLSEVLPQPPDFLSGTNFPITVPRQGVPPAHGKAEGQPAQTAVPELPTSSCISHFLMQLYGRNPSSILEAET